MTCLGTLHLLLRVVWFQAVFVRMQQTRIDLVATLLFLAIKSRTKFGGFGVLSRSLFFVFYLTLLTDKLFKVEALVTLSQLYVFYVFLRNVAI